MSSDRPSCPECKGTKGIKASAHVVEHYETEWGQPLIDPWQAQLRVGLCECLDCGARFQFDALVRKGLIQ